MRCRTKVQRRQHQ